MQNTVGKEEHAGYQFSTLSEREFVIIARLNLSSANASNLVMSKNLSFGKGLTLYHIIQPFSPTFIKKGFENIVGKGENLGNQHFLHSIFSMSTLFSTQPKANFSFLITYEFLSAIALNLDKPNIFLFGKELTVSQTSPDFYVSALQLI